jgi:hypothetical protein
VIRKHTSSDHEALIGMQTHQNFCARNTPNIPKLINKAGNKVREGGSFEGLLKNSKGPHPLPPQLEAVWFI